MPPIFEPEVAADAIVRAAEHRRRGVWVGASTYSVITGGFLAPWLADRYLARTNFEDQQTDLPIEADRFELPLWAMFHDPGAHGIFDEQSKPGSTVSVGRFRPVWVSE